MTLWPPDYLTLDEVVEINKQAIGRYGGRSALRDRGALESSIAQPQSYVFGTERFPSLEAKAAAYCFFISQNQPFINGNKRTGFLSALRFLHINTVIAVIDKNRALEVLLSVARGEADITALVALFKTAIRDRPTEELTY